MNSHADYQLNNLEAINYLNTACTTNPASNKNAYRKIGRSKQNIYIQRSSRSQATNCKDLNYIGIVAGSMARDFSNILEELVHYISLTRCGVEQESLCSFYLDRAETITNLASSMTSRLNDITRQYRPNKTIVSVCELINQSVNEGLQETHIDVKMDTSCGAIIRADKVQMRMVFDQIIMNARQAMPTNGTLTINTRIINLSTANHLLLLPGNYMNITFIDNGFGISPQNMERIFEPHFTTFSDRKGLGLTSALAVINEHYGQIEVESTVGQGSKVNIYIPIAFTI